MASIESIRSDQCDYTEYPAQQCSYRASHLVKTGDGEEYGRYCAPHVVIMKDELTKRETEKEITNES